MREPPIWEKPIFELTADIAADSANRKSCQPTISELREYGDAACCSGPLVGTKSPLAIGAIAQTSPAKDELSCSNYATREMASRRDIVDRNGCKMQGL